MAAGRADEAYGMVSPVPYDSLTVFCRSVTSRAVPPRRRTFLADARNDSMSAATVVRPRRVAVASQFRDPRRVVATGKMLVGRILREVQAAVDSLRRTFVMARTRAGRSTSKTGNTTGWRAG